MYFKSPQSLITFALITYVLITFVLICLELAGLNFDINSLIFSYSYV